MKPTEAQYQPDPDLVVEPAFYSGGVPVFKPSMAQFADFYKFNKAINKYGMQSGIVKVVPPPEWHRMLEGCYTEENLRGVVIKKPIVQHINSSGNGVFSQQNVEKQRTYDIFQWKELSERSNYQPPAPKRARGDEKTPQKATESDKVEPVGSKKASTPPLNNRLRHKSDLASPKTPKKHLENSAYTVDASEFDDERCEQLETAYWKSLTYAEPMYGADMLGSLFPSNFKHWNVAKLPNILDLMDSKLPGVNDAYLYAGLWKATFAWHLEDQDLYLINYIHFGAPKQWYSIPQDECSRFFDLMKDLFSEEYRMCPEFLRHKTFLVSPQLLAKHGIRHNKLVHREGEFVITYPFGYHAGFNYGYNLAESVNFALDDWFPFGRKTKKCECISDSVGINVDQIYCKFKGIPYEPFGETEDPEEHITEEDTDPIPILASKKKASVKRAPRPSVKRESAAVKKKSLTPQNGSYECVLCPNNLPDTLTRTRQFQLLLGDIPSAKVHRVCAEKFPNELQFVRISPTDEVVSGLGNISRAQRGLRCQVCDSSLSSKQKKPSETHGACFQCDTPKCIRAYHGSCSVAGGVLFNAEKGTNYCKFHRTKVSKLTVGEKTMEHASKIPEKSLVQFSIPSHNVSVTYRPVFCGLVVSNSISEQSMEVLVYPQLVEKLEVSYENVWVGSQSECDNSYFLTSGEAVVAPDSRKRKSDSEISYSSKRHRIILEVEEALKMYHYDSGISNYAPVQDLYTPPNSQPVARKPHTAFINVVFPSQQVYSHDGPS